MRSGVTVTQGASIPCQPRISPIPFPLMASPIDDFLESARAVKEFIEAGNDPRFYLSLWMISGVAHVQESQETEKTLRRVPVQ